SLSFQWYAGMAILFALLLLPGGWWFFARNTQNASVVWHLPWLWVVMAATGSLLLSPLLTIMEGCGLVAEIALMTLLQGIVRALCLWFVFWRGWGLYGGPLCTSAGVLVALIWIWTRRRHFLFDLRRMAPAVPTLSWRNEVWPLQWKFAISWL